MAPRKFKELYKAGKRKVASPFPSAGNMLAYMGNIY